jgi:hypothetical protein
MSVMKQKVCFKFDERSHLTEEEFRRWCSEEGWGITEVNTVIGTVLIPNVTYESVPLCHTLSSIFHPPVL